jgi:hypothetical protein
MVVANVLNATVRTASVGSELAFHEGLQKKSFEVKRVKIFAKIRIKSSGKILARRSYIIILMLKKGDDDDYCTELTTLCYRTRHGRVVLLSRLASSLTTECPS